MCEKANLRWPDDPASQFCYLFAVSVNLLEMNFGSLRTIQDWRTLYCHLVSRSSKWTKATGIPRDRLLVNFTIILFQTLCPVKLAFFEGQARMVSVAHWIRQIVPGDPQSTVCVEGIHRFISNKATVGWSIQETGTKGPFRIVVPVRMEPGGNVDASILGELAKKRSNCLLEDALAISKSYISKVDIAEGSHFCDTVHGLINVLNGYDMNPTEMDTIETFTEALKLMAVKHVYYDYPLDLTKLSSTDAPSKDGQSRIDYISKLLAKGAVLPVFGITHEKGATQLSGHKILMCVCATLLVSEKSRLNIAELVALNWTVARAPGTKVNNVPIEEFNKNTYVSLEANVSGIFQEHLFQVRNTVFELECLFTQGLS
jgi:hypothetical protein